MKELKVFAAFSGLGMQELGIHMSNVYDYDWVHSITSEVEPNVIIARACSNNFGNEIDEHEVDEITKCRRKAPVLGHGDIRRPILLVF